MAANKPLYREPNFYFWLSIMNFQQILATVADDFAAVDHFIIHHLDSRVPLIMQVGNYLVEGGGKRLRPLVCLLAARATGYNGDQHISAAAIIEMLHTATLIHDDVVDESDLRRKIIIHDDSYS